MDKYICHWIPGVHSLYSWQVGEKGRVNVGQIVPACIDFSPNIKFSITFPKPKGIIEIFDKM